MDIHQRYQLRPGAVAWRRVGDTAIVLDLGESEYVELNDTATAIVELLVDGATVDDIATHLADQFDVDAALARVDVEVALSEFARRRWLS